MDREGVYQRAWQLFKKRTAEKTSWGRNELATLMAECLEEALSQS